MAGDALAAERSLLSAMVLDPAAIPEGLSLVSPDDFSLRAHREVHRAIRELHEAGSPVDLVTLSAGIPEGTLEPGYLAGLVTAPGVTRNLPGYARLVRDAARLRRLKADAVSLLEALDRNDAPTAQAIVAGLDAAVSRNDGSRHVSAGLSELFTSGVLPSLPLPLAGLDRLKIRPGSLTAFAARPGAGKSAMLAALALEAAGAGWQTLFVTLEMPALELKQRFVAALSGSPLSAVVEPGELTHDLIAASQRLAGLPLWLEDLSGKSLDLERIVRDAAGFAADHPKPLLVLDYLQLVHTRERHEKRHEAIGHVCRELKRLALRSHLPVVTAAQLGRAVEQRGKDARPQLSDLRESGDIENTCDNVVLMHPEDDHVALRIAKQRMGPRFTTRCLFIPESCSFTDAGGFA